MSRKSDKKGRGLLKAFILLFALLVLPFSVSLVVHFPGMFRAYASVTGKMYWAMGGFGFFILFFFIFGAPVKSYILEHEISHVLFALMSGVRIKKISLKRSNAYVKTERVNIVIALAPYSLPLYTLFLIVVYSISSKAVSHPLFTAAMYFLFGVTLSFHIVATIHYLQLDQPDLTRYGYAGSLVLVFTWSLIVLSIIFFLMFRKIDLYGFFQASVKDAFDVYRILFSYLSRQLRFLRIRG